MNKLTPIFIVGLVLVSCTEQQDFRSAYPVLGKDPIEAVTLVENHSEALVHWAKNGVRDAVLVNIDAHDDLRRIPTEKIEMLKSFFEKKDWSAMKEAEWVGDASSYNVGSFIYAAAKLGIVKEVYWIIPFDYFSHPDTENRLKELLRAYDFSENDLDTFVPKDGCFRGRTHDIPLNLCGIEALPDIESPLILSIDADFYPPMASAYGVNKMLGIRILFDELYKKRYKIRDALIAYSVNGGYLGVINRWIGEETAEVLRRPDIIHGLPPKLWIVRQSADAYYEQNRAGLLKRYISPYLGKYKDDPSLMMYAAFAYYGVGDIERAFDYGEKACLINKGYCFGLADIGQNLIDTGRLSYAMKFFESAYSMHPEMNFRQMNLAKALKKAGRYREALSYFERYRSMNGSFPVDFLMGETFLLLGDEESALKHFNRGRKYLDIDPYAAVRNQENANAILSAIAFYEEKGYPESAERLRKHPKLKTMFDAYASSHSR